LTTKVKPAAVHFKCIALCPGTLDAHEEKIRKFKAQRQEEDDAQLNDIQHNNKKL
jgi:hypothetical protein